MSTDDAEETLRKRLSRAPDEYEVDQSLIGEQKDSHLQMERYDAEARSTRVSAQQSTDLSFGECEQCEVLRETIKEKNNRLAVLFMLSCALFFLNLFLFQSVSAQKRKAHRR